jgi:hypothetical protein
LVVHDFRERLNFSEGIELSEGIFEHLFMSIPGAQKIERANTVDDRNGVDYWVRRNGIPPVSVDVKHREFCPIKKWGTDDACIETTSVYTGPKNGGWLDQHRKKIGWTLNPNKRTDLILYTWPAEGQSLRFWILYFPFLCQAARMYWREWAGIHGEKPSLNDGYLTLATYPPRTEIAKKIRILTTGTV